LLVGGLDLGTRTPALAVVRVSSNGTRELCHVFAPRYTRKAHTDKWVRLRQWGKELETALRANPVDRIGIEDPRGTVFGKNRDKITNNKTSDDMRFCFGQAVAVCWLLGIEVVMLQPQVINATLGIVLPRGLDYATRRKLKKQETKAVVLKRIACGALTLTEDSADAAAVALATIERGK